MTKQAFLKLARQRYTQAEEADQAQRERELADLRFYAGEQWEKSILDSRAGTTIMAGTNQQVVPARPSLTINKTREPVRQVLNQERQSDMGIELIPADDWGELSGPIDHTEIELREGLVRRIQRDSEAADARTWAFARSAIAGRGYWLVLTRYVPGKSADQEVYVERIFNQSSVLLDPAHEQPDGSDAQWGFWGVDMPWEQYQTEFPSTADRPNRVASIENDEEWRTLGEEAPKWFHGEGETRGVRVMNYVYTETTTKTLHHLTNGQAVYAEELKILPPGVSVLTDDEGQPITHEQQIPTIKWAKIDGVNILDETDWPGHFLPIIKELGEELQPYDNERRSEGIVRPMRDPCVGNNYIISKFVEQVGLTPIPPWMMAGGQDEGFEAEYEASTTRTLPVLHYNQKDQFKQPAPPPSRTNVSTDVQPLAFGMQVFGQAIASTSLVPETALGNADPTVKSGKLAKMLLDQAERGTSNFMDNHKRSIRHEARVINDLLYPIYGRTGRLARMMNPEGEMASVIIGQPFVTQGTGKLARPMPFNSQQHQGQQPKQYRLTKDAGFNVAVKVSKDYNTRRQQESETLGEMIAAAPNLMQVLGDLFFKYQDGPGHEEMSERMKAVLLPQVQATLQGQQAPSQEMLHAKQQMSEMGQELQKLQQVIQSKQVESQAAFQEAQLKAQAQLQQTQLELASKEKIAIIQASATMTTVQAKIDAEDARTFVDAMEERLGKALNLHLEKLGLAHEAMTQARDQQHEIGMAHLTAALTPAPVAPTEGA